MDDRLEDLGERGTGATPPAASPPDVGATPAIEDEEPMVFRVARPNDRRDFLRSLTRAVAATSAVAAADGCATGKDGPAGTTTSSSTTTTVLPNFALTGVVSNASTGKAIAGALVTIIDGVNATRASTTDANGVYNIPTLVQSTFNTTASASGYNPMSLGMTLTRDSRLDFALQPLTTTTTTTTTAPTTTSTTTTTAPTTTTTTSSPTTTTTPTTTTSVRTTTTTTLCTCNPVCSCNTVCTCNPQTYFYPN